MHKEGAKGSPKNKITDLMLRKRGMRKQYVFSTRKGYVAPKDEGFSAKEAQVSKEIIDVVIRAIKKNAIPSKKDLNAGKAICKAIVYQWRDYGMLAEYFSAIRNRVSSKTFNVEPFLQECKNVAIGEFLRRITRDQFHEEKENERRLAEKKGAIDFSSFYKASIALFLSEVITTLEDYVFLSDVMRAFSDSDFTQMVRERSLVLLMQGLKDKKIGISALISKNLNLASVIQLIEVSKSYKNGQRVQVMETLFEQLLELYLNNRLPERRKEITTVFLSKAILSYEDKERLFSRLVVRGYIESISKENMDYLTSVISMAYEQRGEGQWLEVLEEIRGLEEPIDYWEILFRLIDAGLKVDPLDFIDEGKAAAPFEKLLKFLDEASKTEKGYKILEGRVIIVASEAFLRVIEKKCTTISDEELALVFDGLFELFGNLEPEQLGAIIKRLKFEKYDLSLETIATKMKEKVMASNDIDEEVGMQRLLEALCYDKRGKFAELVLNSEIFTNVVRQQRIAASKALSLVFASLRIHAGLELLVGDFFMTAVKREWLSFLTLIEWNILERGALIAIAHSAHKEELLGKIASGTSQPADVYEIPVPVDETYGGFSDDEDVETEDDGFESQVEASRSDFGFEDSSDEEDMEGFGYLTVGVT